MTKLLLINLLLLGIQPELSAQCLLDYSAYRLVWSDEFNYPTNNIAQLNDKWLFQYNWQTPSNTTINVSPSDRYFWDNSQNAKLFKDTSGNGFVSLGATHLSTPRNINGVDYEYTSSILESNYDSDCPGSWEPYGFFYGIFEVRCKVAKGGGGMNAVWLDGHGFETDIFETDQSPDSKRAFFATTQKGPLSANSCSTFYDWQSGDPSDDFHTYTLAWTNKKLTWFIDGKEIRTNDISYGFPYNSGLCQSQKMSIILSTHPHGWDTYGWNQDCQVEPMIIDYVRVYRPKNFPDNYPIPDNYTFPNYKSDFTYNIFDINKFINLPAINNYNVSMVANRYNNSDYLFVNSLGKLWYINSNSLTSNDSATWTLGSVLANNVSADSKLSIDKSDNNVFYKGTDNELWVYSPITSLNSSLDELNLYPNDLAMNTPLVVTTIPELRIYYKNESNQISYFEFKNSTIPNWQKHTTPINTSNNEFCACAAGDGIYYRGNDGELWIYSYDYSTNNYGKPRSLDPANLYPDNVSNSISAIDSRIYYNDNLGRIWYYEFDSISHALVKYKSIISNSGGDILPKIKNNDGCFYIAGDNDIYSYHIFNDEWVYNKINFLYSDKMAVNNLVSSTTNPNRIFYVDKANHIRYFQWTSCENINPVCQTNNLISFGPGKPNIAEPIVFPNPFTSSFIIKTSRSMASVSLFDIQGRLLLKSDDINNNTAVINTADIVAGPKMLYIVFIDGSFYKQKIVKF